MKTVGVRMEWVEEAEEVAVAGEFNGWVTVPLIKEKLSLEEAQLLFPQASAPPATLWTVLLQMEPGCYTFKFLVDGEWKTREGDELEEDEKGELNAIIVVEEEEEDEEEATVEEVKAAEAVKEAVERVEEDLDVLTLNISLCGEKSFMEMTDKNDIVPQEKDINEDAAKKEIKLKETKVEEKKAEMIASVEAKMEVSEKEDKTKTVKEESTIEPVKEEAKKETVGEEAKVGIIMEEATIETVELKTNVGTIKEDPMVEPVEEAKKVDDKENNPKVVKEAPPKRVTRRSILPSTPTLPITPKVVKEAPPKRVTRRSIVPGTPTLPATPKGATPNIRASKLDKVVTDKIVAEDVESPRRTTRTTLKNVKNN